MFEEKRLRLGGAHPGEAQRLAELQGLLRLGEDWFTARGATPDVPNESDVAVALGLPALYQIVYRIASKTTHFSLFSMVEGFDGPFEPGKLLRPIPLLKRTSEYTENILMWAIVSYAEMLERADPVVRLDLGERVRELVLPWLEDHPYRVHPEEEPLDRLEAQL